MQPIKIEQTITIILISLTSIGIGSEIFYFYIPYWFDHLDQLNFSLFSQFVVRILSFIANILVVIGAIRLMSMQEVKFLKIFRFPLYLYVIQTVLFALTCLFSKEFSFFIPHEGAPFYILPLRVVNAAFVLLIAYYYLSIKKIPTYERTTRKVNKSARFFNRIIDGSLIILLSYSYIDLLSYGETIFSSGSFSNSNNYWLFPLYTIVYYLVLELLFHQTIGKLHNNSFVKIEQNRFGSILVRTLTRFIPFEPFSFFGLKGWHDGFSKTSVVKIDTLTEETDDSILDDFLNIEKL
jgi:hypothetical protein